MLHVRGSLNTMFEEMFLKKVFMARVIKYWTFEI